MDHPQWVQLVIFWSVLFSMLLAETLWRTRAWHAPRWKRFSFHLLLSLGNTLWLRVLAVPPLLFWLHWVQSQGWGLAGWLGLVGPIEMICTLILFDCLDYWWHRANHLVPFLWCFHRAHHLDTHVDVTTALRFHPGELLISTLVKACWIGLWGPSLWGFVLFESGITAYALFHHTNIDFSDRIERAVRWIHITPRLHASHHTVTRRTRDANYATIFSIWDRLFGSFQEPDDQEMKHLGLERGRETDLSPTAFLKAPFTI